MKSSALFHKFEYELSPSTSTSCQLDVIYVISVPRLFLFFTALPLPCIILNTKQRTKQGKLGNEAKVNYAVAMQFWEHMRAGMSGKGFSLDVNPYTF